MSTIGLRRFLFQDPYLIRILFEIVRQPWLQRSQDIFLSLFDRVKIRFSKAAIPTKVKIAYLILMD